MANEKMKPQSPEEIARAAQEAALEQIRAMMGSIPGMPDMGDMQAQIMTQMQAAVPDLAGIQAQQAAMGTLGEVDAAAVTEAARLAGRGRRLGDQAHRDMPADCGAASADGLCRTVTSL